MLKELDNYLWPELELDHIARLGLDIARRESELAVRTSDLNDMDTHALLLPSGMGSATDDASCQQESGSEEGGEMHPRCKRSGRSKE